MKQNDSVPAAAIFSYWKRFTLPAGATVLVACSGGPDAVALLRAFLDVKDRLDLTIRAVNIDHAIRPDIEMERERLFLGELSNRFDCEIEMISLGKTAVSEAMRERKDGLESAARRLRYAAIDAFARSIDSGLIAFAHTRDDQAETVLMRFFKGSGPAGLKGIPPKNGKIIRPFLDTSKTALLEYLDCLNIPFSRDSTNDSPDPLRNRIRLEILPFLLRKVPEFKSALLRTAGKNSGIADYLMQEARQIAWKSDESGWQTDADGFYSRHEALRIESLYCIFDRLKPDTRLPWHLVKLVSEKRPLQNGILFSFSGIFCEYRFGALLIGNRRIEEGFNLSVTAPGEYIYGKNNKISIYWIGQGLTGIPECVIQFPFVFRSILAGDRISIKGGHKKVNDLLAEQGLDPLKKSKVPIIEHKGKIVAVLAEFVGGKTRFAEFGINPALPEFVNGKHLVVAMKGIC